MKVDGREITVFQGEYKTSPLIVLNTVQGEGEEIHKITKGLSASDFTLLSVQIDDWNSAMTPWKAEAVASWDSGYEGKADEYIESLTQRIIPEVIVRYSLCPSFIAIAGYSLGGLFALYSMYRTDIFTRFASVSGSLWYPGFAEYTETWIPFLNGMRGIISMMPLSEWLREYDILFHDSSFKNKGIVRFQDIAITDYTFTIKKRR